MINQKNPGPSHEEFVKRLNDLFHQHEITKAEFAELCGLTVFTLSRWLNRENTGSTLNSRVYVYSIIDQVLTGDHHVIIRLSGNRKLPYSIIAPGARVVAYAKDNKTASVICGALDSALDKEQIND